MITEIGKIKIKWDVKPKLIKKRLLKHYRNFLTSDGRKVDIRVEVRNKSFKISEDAVHLLKTRSWEYLKCNNKRIVYFPQRSKAEIAEDFKTVKFFTSDDTGQLLLYLFPEILYSLILPEFSGLLLHASGIKMGERIFVFLAPSRGGKSTISKLAIKNGLTLLNDDRIILKKVKGKYFAFGNPWHGELEITSSESGEIKELFFLKKAKKNFIKEISKKEMFLSILESSFYLKEDKKHFQKVIEIIADMVDNLEGYMLGFRPDERIWSYLDGKFK